MACPSQQLLRAARLLSIVGCGRSLSLYLCKQNTAANPTPVEEYFCQQVDAAACHCSEMSFVRCLCDCTSGTARALLVAEVLQPGTAVTSAVSAAAAVSDPPQSPLHGTVCTRAPGDPLTVWRDPGVHALLHTDLLDFTFHTTAASALDIEPAIGMY